MALNIQKLIDASLFFLSKDGYPFSKKRLNSFLLMADVKHMENHAVGITDDVINCLSSGPELHLTKQVFSGYMFTEDWQQYFVKTNEDKFLIKHNRISNALTLPEKETLKQVFKHFGDLSEDSIKFILQNMAMEWHEAGVSKFNPFLFFKSLGFNEDQAIEKQDVFLERMKIDKSTLNDFFERYNACREFG